MWALSDKLAKIRNNNNLTRQLGIGRDWITSVIKSVPYQYMYHYLLLNSGASFLLLDFKPLILVLESSQNPS